MFGDLILAEFQIFQGVLEISGLWSKNFLNQNGWPSYVFQQIDVLSDARGILRQYLTWILLSPQFFFMMSIFFKTVTNNDKTNFTGHVSSTSASLQLFNKRKLLYVISDIGRKWWCVMMETPINPEIHNMCLAPANTH